LGYFIVRLRLLIITMLTEAQNNAAFDMTAVEDGIWQIKEPWYAEHANMYLFEGSDYPLLIDAGIGTANVNSFFVWKRI